MYIIEIDVAKCKGDGDCVENCPVEILEIREENGKKIAVVAGDPDECLGCLACEEMCEEGAIKITEY